MSLRSRTLKNFGSLLMAVGLGALGVGCSDVSNMGTLSYSHDPRLQEALETQATDTRVSQEDQADLSGLESPAVREGVITAVANLFGDQPNRIFVPNYTGLTADGLLLGNYTAASLEQFEQNEFARVAIEGQPVEKNAGGYALYRRHCLHCHGVSGDGNGPTAEFLFPKPRNFQPGLYKFVSTGSGLKPNREDLRRTLKYGLHGSSMPSFEALLSDIEIEQVIEYTIFLSMRGETERLLVDNADFIDPTDSEAATASAAEEAERILFGNMPEEAMDPSGSYADNGVADRWIAANDQTAYPLVPRTPRSPASIERGRNHFLKLGCVGCHGIKADGNGQTFTAKEIFDDIYFRRGYPINKTEEQQEGIVLEAIADYLEGQAFLAHHVSHGVDGEHHDDESIAMAEPPTDTQPTEVPELNEEQQAVAANFSLTEEQQALLVQFNLNELEVAVMVDRGLDQVGVQELTKLKKQWYDSLDEWGNPRRANNLTQGIYRGGRRPLDIFWRLHNGINGVGMPSYVKTLMPTEGDETEQLKEAHAAIWDIVNFVLELPHDPTLLHGYTEEDAAGSTDPAMASTGSSTLR